MVSARFEINFAPASREHLLYMEYLAVVVKLTPVRKTTNESYAYYVGEKI